MAVDMVKGEIVQLEFVVTEQDMALFQKLSGDTNPLHSDAAFARARGFGAPVVFGGLLVAQISRLLGNHLPGPGCVWQNLTLRFRAPLAVGQPALLVAEVRHLAAALNVLVLKIEVRAADGNPPTVFAEGEVSAKLAVPSQGPSQGPLQGPALASA
jgi:3-hydroxybutyryl-CoA dehydratase